MEQKFNITISKPCSKNFKHFIPTAKGGFCDSCKKEVIDFRTMTDEQLANYFNNDRVNTCGYFKAAQLKEYHTIKNRRDSGFGLLKVGVFAVFSLFSLHNVQAQAQVQKTEIVQNKRQTEKSKETKVQERLLRGMVSDETSPLPGVNIVLKGTAIGTATNFDGEFEFPRALKTGDVLIVSYLGYETQEITVKENQALLNIVLPESSIYLMGEVDVNEVYEQKRSLWQKLKDVF